MHNVPVEKRDAVIKLLAIVGFLGVIVLIAWIAVQIVSFIPSAFSSLASLAGGLYREESPVAVTVTASETIVNAGETFTVNWEGGEEGTYTFSYQCADGVEVSLVGADGTRSLDCGTTYNLGTATTAELLVTGADNRFSDLTYRVSFVPTGAETPATGTDDVVTIVDASVPTDVTIVDADEPTDEAPEVAPTPSEEGETPSATPAPAPTPTYTEEYVYQLPVSNPNGYVDLAATFIGSGTLGANNAFVPTLVLDNDARGAVQFEVKNLGTKTSNEWTFTATLPNGATFSADEQAPLRPNERSVITLSFTLGDATGAAPIAVTVDTSTDRLAQNDAFAWSVNVVE